MSPVPLRHDEPWHLHHDSLAIHEQILTG